MKRVLILVGAAPCVADDLARLPVILQGVDYMAIGLDAANKLNKQFKCVVSYEPFDLPQFFDRRAKMGFPGKIPTYSQEPYKDYVDYVYPELQFTGPDQLGYSGSSSLLGVKIGFKLGYQKMILCGCPLDAEQYRKFQTGWLFVRDLIADRVRSMSGWTRELLGSPTEEWLQSDASDAKAIKNTIQAPSQEEIPFNKLFYSLEPNIPVVGGPLYEGYKKCLAGNFEGGKQQICEFLVDVYLTRLNERLTHNHVLNIYREEKRSIPPSRAQVPKDIVLRAAKRRFDESHAPLFHSIVLEGFVSGYGDPIYIRRKGDKILLVDGKNRCSILAAMGFTSITNTRWDL